MPPAMVKGKAKAIDRTPLLDDHGNPTVEAGPEDPLAEDAQVSAASGHSPWRSHLLTAALVLFSICFAVLIVIVLLAESYAAPAWRNIDQALSQPGGEAFWKKAVRIRGVDAVNVLGVDNVQDDKGVSQLQTNISVTLRITVDTDLVMGFRNDQLDGWWARRWKNIGRWGIRRLHSTTAIAEDINIYPSSYETSGPLLTIKPLSHVPIRLSPDFPNQLSSLTPVSISFLVVPSGNASYLRDFVEKSWAKAFVSVRIRASGVQVYGGRYHSTPPKWWQFSRWRNWLKLDKAEVNLKLSFPIPPLHMPSHPPTKPGSHFPALSELLHLESFAVTSAPSPVLPQPAPSSTPQRSHSVMRPQDGSINTGLVQKILKHETYFIPPPLSSHAQSPRESWNIIISAKASLPQPFSDLIGSRPNFKAPPFPFTIALPVHQHEKTSSLVTYTTPDKQYPRDLIPVSEVYALPSLNRTHVIISISGYLLPLSNSSPDLADAISAFVSSYLSYKASAIAISTSLYPSLIMKASFPPPSERLELLKNVTIENMSIRPGFGSISLSGSDSAFQSAFEILATATVHARVVLPQGVNINIDVGRLWIDLIVFDGEVPSENATRAAPFSDSRGPPVPEPRPLPDPLPERAFARITPKEWLNASSSRSPPGDMQGNGSDVYVTAEIVDVPLEVLPGRGDELSKFVTKVLFSSDPVVAGIRGVAAVGVSVPGLTNPVSERGVKGIGSELILTGLPFEGNVHVGGKKFT